MTIRESPSKIKFEMLREIVIKTARDMLREHHDDIHTIFNRVCMCLFNKGWFCNYGFKVASLTFI